MTITLNLNENLSGIADSSATGSGWGSHLMPIVRRSDGTVFTTYIGNGIPGPQVNYTHPWYLLQNGKEIFAGNPEVLEKPNLFLDGQGRLVVIWWANGQPMEMVLENGFNIKAIPGKWYGQDGQGNVITMLYPYSTGCVLEDGRIVIMRVAYLPGAQPSNVPGIVQWAIRELTGVWSPVRSYTLQNGRVAYTHLFGTANGGMAGTGTRDVTWQELGFTPNNPSFGYCFNRLVRLTWFDVTKDPIEAIVAEDAPVAGDFNVYFTAVDEYVDLLGNAHTLGYSQSFGKYRLDHFINGVKKQEIDLIYGNMARIAQFASGEWIIFSVYLDDVYYRSSADGINWGPQQHLAFGAGYQYASDHPYIASTRNGSKRSDTIDIVQLNGGHYWQHWQLKTDSVAPAPTPTPTPDPVPTPTPDARTYEQGRADGINAIIDAIRGLVK